MLAASALGTSFGDLWTNHLGISGPVAFTVLVVVCAGTIWADRSIRVETEIAYWVDIVMMRAAATNIADLLTEQLSFNALPLSAGLAILTVLPANKRVLYGRVKQQPHPWSTADIGRRYSSAVYSARWPVIS